MSSIILRNLKKKQLQSLIDDINNNSYYFVLSKPTEWNDELTPDVAADTTNDILGFRNEIIAGKKVKSNDTSFLIRNVSWASGTIYSQYDDMDTDLYTKDYFVLTSTNRVYKCLYNNGGGQSTVEPSETTSDTFKTADGYIWKYMYTMTDYAYNRFGSSSYIPVTSNSISEALAVAGALDVISIDNGGEDYTAVSTGSVVEVINQTTFRIEDNNSSSSNGFYNSSGFYITSGGGVGGLSKIGNFIANSSGKYVVTTDTITGVDVTSLYRITPYISIVGDGTGATAYSTVSSGVIDSVTIITPGSGYSFANVVVSSNSSYGSGANLHAVIPPDGGHGSDAILELGGGDVISIAASFIGDELGTIPTEVSFRKAGLISNPTYYSNNTIYNANTLDGMHTFTISTSESGFPLNEYMETDDAGGSITAAFSNSSVIKAVNYRGTFITYDTLYPGTISVSGNTITGTSTEFQTSPNGYNFSVADQFNPDFIVFSDENGSYLYRVTVITDNTTITISELDGTDVNITTISNTAMTYRKYQNDRLIPSTVSGYSYILNINNPDINKSSGEILYLNYIESTQRSANTVENAKLILKI